MNYLERCRESVRRARREGLDPILDEVAFNDRVCEILKEFGDRERLRTGELIVVRSADGQEVIIEPSTQKPLWGQVGKVLSDSE